MTGSPTDGGELRFSPTSGTAIGWLALAATTGAAAWVFLDEPSVVAARWALALAIVAVVVWCFMLRPRVVIRDREVELRNALSSWHVPLGAVRRVVVRAFTRVHTDDGQYDAVAVGRSVRSMRRGRPAPPTVGIPGFGGVALPAEPDPPSPDKGRLDAEMVADYVTERILERAEQERAVSPEPTPARRTWAVPELTLLVVLAVALVVTLVV